jgi:cysteinyl-tRNA synthetase
MSKSLKNFITIREALKRYSWKEIRLTFLMHKYTAPMDYGDDNVEHAITSHRRFTEFFHAVKAVMRDFNMSSPHKLREAEQGLLANIEEAKAAIHAAYCDDFNTPLVLTALLDLVRQVNSYFEANEAPVRSVVRMAGELVTRHLTILGLVKSADQDGIANYSMDGSGGEGESELLGQVLDSLTEFRDTVRGIARGQHQFGKEEEEEEEALSVEEQARRKEITLLQECDRLRDEVMPPLGVRMEDSEGAKGVWKLEDPGELLKEMERKAEEEERKRAEKEQMRAEREAKQKEEEAKLAIPPEDLFRTEIDPETGACPYSAFDEEGIPTHLADGEEVPKKRKKKLVKIQNSHKTKIEKWNKQ